MQQLDIVRSRELSALPKPPRDTASASSLGTSAIILAFGVLALWAILAPLSGAVIAVGKFIASGQNKIVQHLEGGIVREILVAEGDLVEAGDVMLRLDETATNAMLRRLELRHYRSLAMRARLKAEQAGAREIAFPQLLLAKVSDIKVGEILATQKDEYATRRAKLDSEIDVFKRRRNGAAEEIAGLKAQHEAVSAQVKLIDRELAATEKLFDQGYTTLTRLLALRRSHAQLKGDLGQLTAQVARAEEKVAEHDREIDHLKSKHSEAALEELRQVEAEVSDLEEQVVATRDVLNRLEVRAPVKGVVVSLTQNTNGGVLASGQDIVELLPIDEDLIVEARVRPQDIDSIAVGHTARIRLTALNQRVTPTLGGEVVYVSADTRQTQANGAPYYLARIKLPDEEAARLQTLSPVPGMPVEVFIDTGARSFADYLLRPVMDSFSRAFRES